MALSYDIDSLGCPILHQLPARVALFLRLARQIVSPSATGLVVRHERALLVRPQEVLTSAMAQQRRLAVDTPCILHKRGLELAATMSC